MADNAEQKASEAVEDTTVAQTENGESAAAEAEVQATEDVAEGAVDEKSEEPAAEEAPAECEKQAAETPKAAEPEEEEDEDDRKLFVGGLSWETETNTLKDYMAQYGEVTDCTIKVDNKTGRSRCFGFVIFKEVAGLDKALENRPHKVDSREIDSKKAEPQRKEGKLFVGGVKPETSDDIIKEYFSKYGVIEKLERPFDQKNQKPKGFCFVTYKKDGPIAKIITTRYHDLDGKKVECKHAEPPSRGFGEGRGGRGGGRGGMGGWGPGYGGGFGGGYGGGFNQGFGGFGGGYGGGFQGGYGGYGGFGGGGFNQGFGGGYSGGGGFGGGGYGFGQQSSGFGKSGRGRNHNFKPY